MAKFKFPQNSFFKGEVSPKLYSRTDLKEYSQACKELLNAIPSVQGGAGRRAGSQFIAGTLRMAMPPFTEYPHTMTSGGIETTTTTNPKRIIPFVTPDTTYAIIIGVTDPTKYSTAAGYGPFYVVEVSDINDFINGVDSTLVTQNIGELSAVTGDFAGYTAAQLSEVQFAQSGDVMILTHPECQPAIIWRQFSISGSGVLIGFGISPFYNTLVNNGNMLLTTVVRNTLDTAPVPYTVMPFQDQNTDTTLTLSVNNAAVGTGRTMTASSGLFTTSHVGAYYKITTAAVTGLVKVTGFTSQTVVTVEVIRALGGTGAYPNWEESAWSDYRGWPRSVCFYQQRAIYGGSKHFPNTIWASRVGNFQWLDAKGYADGGARSESTRDADNIGQAAAIAYGERVNIDPYSARIAATEASPIQWMSPDKNLIVGTKEREWIGKGPDPAQVMGPFNIDFSPETKHGTTFVQPARFGNGLMFIQQDGQTVREFVFNYQEDAYRAENLSRDAEHMVRKSLAYYATDRNPAIVRVAYQQLDTGILWCLDSNGGLFACSRDRETGQLAWHAHKIGGSYSGETPKVIDICVIPRTEIDATNFSQGEPRHLSDLYMLVLRTVNASTVVYLERIAPEFQAENIDNTSTNINNKPIFCDSAKVKTLGVAGTSFSGFDHLEGQTVECILDGSYVGTKVVSGGIITTDSSGLQLIAGLSFRTIINPLYLEAGSIIGSAIGTKKKIDTLVMNFVRSVGAKFGKSTATADLEIISMRDSDLAPATATPLFTGQIEKEFPGGYEKDLSVAIVQDDPMPMYLSGFSARGDTND